MLQPDAGYSSRAVAAAASPARPRVDGEAEDDVSDLGSPRVILDDDVSELTEARA